MSVRAPDWGADASVDVLELGSEPDAVPRARRFVVRAMGGAPGDAVEAAVSVATELVTNALLHVGPPVVVRVRRRRPAAVRLEVEDTSRDLPALALPFPEGMTGRGLALVSALARAWGVEAGERDGKVVWAELSGNGSDTARRPDPARVEPDIDGAAPRDASGRHDRPAERVFTIRLGDVPTDLLLAAKAHVDNLVRELTLAARQDDVPAELATLIERVVHRFAVARSAIKRQALAAAEKGLPRCELILSLPVSAAEAGEEYLAALDEADRYARAARLLTLETPPAHRVFRRWYVESLVDQLRRLGAGEPAVPPPTFEQRLVDELADLAAAHQRVDRAARTQAVTSALAGALTTEEVAQVVVTEGAQVLEASGGVLVVSSEGRLAPAAPVGYDAALLDRMRTEVLDENLPAAWAARTGEPVWLESRRELKARFPAMGQLEPAAAALCAVPLRLTGRVLGALRFSFTRPRLFDDDERRFVLALAAQAAQALHRSELYAAERAARAEAERLAADLGASAARLTLLQQVTAKLTGAGDVAQISEIVVTDATATLGATSAQICLLDEDQMLRLVAASGGDLGLAGVREPVPVTADVPGGLALRSGRPAVVSGRAELGERFPSLAGAYPDSHTLIVAPLIVEDRQLGVLSLAFPGERRVVEQTQLDVVTTLADACALALQRAIAAAEARQAADKLALLAEASAELSASFDYRTVLTRIARRLVVRGFADWCAVHLLQDGALTTVAVLHRDPAKTPPPEELRSPVHLDPRAAGGVAAVVRTGRSELHPVVTEQSLAALAGTGELALVRALGVRSRLVVPMKGRTGTVGAISLNIAESPRRYSAEDLAFAEDLGRRAALAIETVHAFSEQTGRLAAVSRVAEAAQRAILAPVPARVGPVTLVARYLSAAAEARVGGDLYEAVPLRGAVRLIVGDVRGKGLDAVRMATVVLGEFRAAATEPHSLTHVASRIDGRLRSHLQDEDFVTAVLAEITDDGVLTVACAGHPPALLAAAGRIVEVGTSDSPPLGLGAAPSLTTARLAPGARLLLYTDGILDARDQQREFVDFTSVVAPLADGDHDTVLDRILAALHAAAGPELGDDLALLMAEYGTVGRR